VTAARVPAGFDWKAINSAVKGEGVILAGGQGPLAGQIFRLGHLGSVTLGEILDAIGVLEQVSIRFERQVLPGAGIAAAQSAALETMGIRPATAAMAASSRAGA
jgi:alanine-glyoxylate transaminase / serine-glyoxylate transaminase / serine-pyruvate transaminase